MREILVTNDDGVHSEGIKILAEALLHLGNVTIVAPMQEASAIGHALTLRRPLRIETIAPKTFGIDGTPTDCVNLAISHVIKQKPDLIVSGINKGWNLGDDITYSGTVSGALEGSLLGIPYRGLDGADAGHVRLQAGRDGGSHDCLDGARRPDDHRPDVSQHQCADWQAEGLSPDRPGEAQSHHDRRSPNRSARAGLLLD